MNPLQCLIEDHAQMRSSLEEISRLLETARNSGPQDVHCIITERLPAAQHFFFTRLKAHEKLEESIFSRAKEMKEGVLPWSQIEAQHESIEEIFKIASALIHLMEEGNLYAISFAMRRVSETIHDHFEYEEKNVFPQVKRLSETPVESDVQAAANWR